LKCLEMLGCWHSVPPSHSDISPGAVNSDLIGTVCRKDDPAMSRMIQALTSPDLLPERIAKATGAVEVMPKRPLSLADRRLFNYLLARAYPTLGKVEVHKVLLSEVRQFAAEARGGQEDADNRRLKDSVTRLMGTVVEFNTLGSDPGLWEASQLLGPCKINKTTGELTYTFPKEIADRLREPALYSLINLKVVFQFESKYALALYEVLQRYADRNAADPYWAVRVEELRNLLGCTDILRDWTDFRRRALDPAIGEISQLAAFKVEMDEFRQGGGRGGGKVVGAVFRVIRKGLDEAQKAVRALEKPKVQLRGERKVKAEEASVARAMRFLDGADAATRMRWAKRAETVGVKVPNASRSDLGRWVPAIARMICKEEGFR
jgi:Initiator Replication protein